MQQAQAKVPTGNIRLEDYGEAEVRLLVEEDGVHGDEDEIRTLGDLEDQA